MSQEVFYQRILTRITRMMCCYLTEFGLFGQERHSIYLPVLTR